MYLQDSVTSVLVFMFNRCTYFIQNLCATSNFIISAQVHAFHSSHPYSALGILIEVYITRDDTGFQLFGRTPLLEILSNVPLSLIVASCIHKLLSLNVLQIMHRWVQLSTSQMCVNDPLTNMVNSCRHFIKHNNTTFKGLYSNRHLQAYAWHMFNLGCEPFLDSDIRTMPSATVGHDMFKPYKERPCPLFSSSFIRPSI